MSKQLLRFTRQMQWALIPLLLVLTQQAWSQCTNGAAFGTFTAPTTNTTLAMSTCIFGGEYNTINSAVAGQTYLFTATGGAGNFLTVHQGTPGGTVLAFGFSPISATVTVSGPIYLHVNTTAGCGTDGTCHSTFIQCTSCSGPPPITNDVCTSALPIACGQTISGSTTGAGIDAVPTCTTTFGTSGGVWYTFTGDGQPTTLSLCGSTYDTKIGVFTGTCASLTCVVGNDDFCGLQSQVSLTSVCGTTYYVLVTGFSTNTGAFTLARTCTAPDPCTSIGTLTCATPVTASTCGAGAYNPVSTSCGFATPGAERIYAFTPTTTGTHTLVVTAASGGFGDYFYKLASGGCNNTGWTCIGDASSPESDAFGPLTAGTTYYILFDPETTGSQSQTFRIDCPAAGSAPPCVVSPTFPTNGSTICPNSNVTLSWPASAGATSYDVYFGTTAVPPFVANVATTSFNVGVQTTGTRFWEIRPRNGAGPAPGCAIWTFTLADNTAPSITCPANVVVNNSPATACSAVATYGSVSATDACGAPAIVLQSGLASGSTFPVGVNVVVFRATDPSGNTATCSFTVTVIDATLPNITCPANITDVNDPGICGAAETYTMPTATDNCGIASVTLQSGQASGSTFPVGTTTNVWRATDVNGNTRTCSFTVSVADNEVPDPVCPPNLLKNNDFGDCGRTIPYLGNLTFADNCGVVATANDSPGFFPVGTTVVTFVVTDNSGNTGTCTQSVTIYDYEYPYVTCPANITSVADEFECAALVDYTATGSDNCPGLTLTYSTDPLSSFEIGYTNVTATVVDAAGNSVNCTFQVHIKPRVEICNDFDDDCDGYTDEAEDWKKVAKRLAKDGAAFDQYGISVDIDGEWAVVGSNKKDQAGANLGGSAYLLRRGADGWFGVLRLQPTDILPGDNFGLDVAISGGVVAVGASSDDDVAGNAGSVYIYYQNPNNPNDWTLLKKIYAPDSATGDNFGGAVDLSGEWLLVGAALKDVTGIDEGQAYVFGRNVDEVDEWGLVAKLNAPNGEANDQFGASVALDGGKAIVGAPGDDDKGAEAGAAYRFDRNQGGADNWGYVAKLLGAQTSGGDAFGKSVAISGPYAVVGAPQNDIQGADAGVAFAFYQNSGSPNGWGQSTFMTNPNGQAGDHFGAGVAIDGEYAVVTAPGDNPHGAGSGQGFVFLLVDQGWGLVDQLSDGDGQTNDGLGYSAALSGRTALLGAPNDDKGVAQDVGSVSFFEGLCTEDATKQAAVRDEANTATSALDVQCYPIPFTDVLTIEVNTTAAVTRISVFNTLGQEIQVLGTDSESGRYLWQAGKMQPGLYYVKVQAGDQVQTKSVLLARP